jgi:hypothetical protein
MDCLCPHLGDYDASDAWSLLELFLTIGSELGAAQSKVAEFFSPPRVTRQVSAVPSIAWAQ